MRVAFSQLEWAPEIVKLYTQLLSNEDSYAEEKDKADSKQPNSEPVQDKHDRKKG